MPLRYLVLVGRGEVDIGPLVRRIEGCSLLASVYSTGRVAVLVDASDAAVPLSNDRGAVVGTLFRRDGPAPRITSFNHMLDPGRSIDPLAILHDRYWGAYIAVTVQGNQVFISRDPSGLLPCLYLTSPDFAAFASDAALLEETGLLTLQVDWPALARLLYANELPQQRMALAGLHDLHAGMSARLDSRAVTISTAWSPWAWTRPEEDVTADRLACELRQTVDMCTASWASEYRQIALAVSGGLDSSILASSLVQDVGAQVTGLTISTDESHGDESAYAQALCAHYGLCLIQGQYDDAAVDIAKSASVHLPRPAGRAPTQAYDAVVHREVARLSADAVFTGSGGDNVFYSTHSVRPLVDRYLAHGLRWNLLETARSISVLTGASLATVLRYARRVPRAPGLKYSWPGDARFLNEDCAHENAAAPLFHPWLEAPENCLPGKASHVAMILRAQHYLDNYDRRLPFTAVHPLLSQPIVEVMLKMPSWYAVAGGRDRAVARMAFSSRFPQLIAGRRLKGGPDAFAIKLLRSNLRRARERLLEGSLCTHGIVDRDALDEALTESGLSRGHDYVRLLLLLDTEAWLEAWAR